MALIFSEVLDAYLDHRSQEPDERDGYTDKGFWRERSRLREQLDSFFKEGPIIL